MYSLLNFLPRLVLLTGAAMLSLHGLVWLPIVLVVLVVWGRGLPQVY